MITTSTKFLVYSLKIETVYLKLPGRKRVLKILVNILSVSGHVCFCGVATKENLVNITEHTLSNSCSTEQRIQTQTANLVRIIQDEMES